GKVTFKHESLVSNYGNIHIQNKGEAINGGRIVITETGAFRCRGSLTNERKGTINNYGSITLEKDSFFAPMGKLANYSGGVMVDDSTHKDWSIYTAEILKDEEEIVKRGIDISYAQGEIDWETLSKSGIDFVIMRCGRGDIDGTGPQADIRFYENIEAANKYGMDVGVYFYTYAETPAQAEREAEFMLTLLEGYTITYPVILDMEESTRRKDLSNIAEAFLEVVAQGGYYPMLYSYQSMLDDHFSDEIKEKYAVWIARLKHKPETDYDYYIWQYSHDGQIMGIKGDVDFDTAYRDFPEILRDYGLNHLAPIEEEEQS
ncbi:MAG: glycoside hydrolase family 25 protein, partial [Ruminiclostridium sp.]|nr:glycoside hydrolase family 25 protein [Ruminiclostridium sp.]